MTPEELKRAQEITAAIGKSVDERRSTGIPGISRERPSEDRNYLLYGAAFAVVLALHVAGYIGYQHFQSQKEIELSRKAAEERERVEIRDEQYRLLREIQTEKERAASYAKAATTAARTVQFQAVNPTPVLTQEYNVYPAKPPRPVPQRPQTYQPQQVVTPQEQVTADDHAAFAKNLAYKYFNTEYKKRIGSRYAGAFPVYIDETTYDQNWQIYRTSGTATVYYENGGTWQEKTEKFEAVTKTEGGRVASDTGISIR